MVRRRRKICAELMNTKKLLELTVLNLVIGRSSRVFKRRLLAMPDLGYLTRFNVLKWQYHHHQYQQIYTKIYFHCEKEMNRLL